MEPSQFVSTCGPNSIPSTLSHSMILCKIFLEEWLPLAVLLGFDCGTMLWGQGCRSGHQHPTSPDLTYL